MGTKHYTYEISAPLFDPIKMPDDFITIQQAPPDLNVLPSRKPRGTDSKTVITNARQHKTTWRVYKFPTVTKKRGGGIYWGYILGHFSCLQPVPVPLYLTHQPRKLILILNDQTENWHYLISKNDFRLNVDLNSGTWKQNKTNQHVLHITIPPKLSPSPPFYILSLDNYSHKQRVNWPEMGYSMEFSGRAELRRRGTIPIWKAIKAGRPGYFCADPEFTLTFHLNTSCIFKAVDGRRHTYFRFHFTRSSFRGLL